MKKKSRISVIIPTYNRANTVGRAIQSVLSQTYQDFEIIVIDDGSTDNTEEVIRSFHDSRIRYIRHKKNRGGSAARNTGIHAARGEYIAFLDSDDEWLPQKLEKQINVMKKSPETWVGVCTGFWLIEEEREKREHIPTVVDDLFHRLLADCFLRAGSTLLVLRSILNKIGGFDENLPRHQDWDLLLRLSKQWKVAIIRECLVKVYVSGRPPADKVLEAKKRLLAKYATDLQKLGPFKRRKIIGKHWLQLSYEYFLEKKIAYGTFYLTKALLQNPFQRPGLYIRLLDATFGTQIGPRISAAKHVVLQKCRKLVANKHLFLP